MDRKKERQYILQKKDGKNHTFCILPWIHTAVNPNGDVHLCCRKSEPVGNINDETLEEIYNSDRLNEIRTKMVNGDPVKWCEKCYYEDRLIENNSTRQRVNKWAKESIKKGNVIQPFSVDDNTIPIEKVSYNNVDNDWVKIFEDQEVKLKWIDIYYSNICNYACRGCYSLLSTKWHDDEKKLGMEPHGFHSIRFDHPSLKIYDIDYIRYLGGEPFLMKQTEEYIDYLLKTEDIDKKILYYITNGSVFPKKKIVNAWKKIKKLVIMFSVDDYGKYNDYFRHGSDWKILRKNLLKYIDLSKKFDMELRVSTVINIYNVGRLDVLYNWLIEVGIKESNIMLNVLHQPREMCIRNLPIDYKKILIERYKYIDLPYTVKTVILKHLKDKSNTPFNDVVSHANKLDGIRGQTNPVKELRNIMVKTTE